MRPLAWIGGLIEGLQGVAPVFLEAALRGAVVLLVALVLSHLLRRRTAAARHLVWVGAVTVQLALPLFALWGPRWEVGVPSAVASVLPVSLAPAATSSAISRPSTSAPRRDETVRDASHSSKSTGPVPAPTAAVDRTSTAVAPAAEPTTSEPIATHEITAASASTASVSGRTILLVVWLIGALVILLRLAAGTAIVAALARRGARVEDGGWLSLAQRLSSSLQIDRPLTLLRGDRIGVPITWGIVYPVVLLPDDADAWPEERRRFVLVHEMAHVKRLDALTQLAGQLALALFWFDPLVWIANRRMQLEREHACDDYVLRHGTSASHYAEELLAMVRSLGASDRTAQPAFAALAMARRSEFEGRMLSILDPVLDRHPLSKGRTVMSALAALLLVVPLAALHPYERADASVSTAARPAASLHRDTSVPTFTLNVGADSALPESFKISIQPSGNASALMRQSVPSAPSQPSSPSLPSSAPSPMWPSSPMSPTSPTSPLSPTSAGGTYEALGAGLVKTADQLKELAKRKPTTSPKSCDEPVVRGTTINSIHENSDDDGSTTYRYLSLKEDGSCTEATLVGRVRFTDAEDDIASMPVTAHAVFRERANGEDREVVIRSAEDGSVAHIFRVNGRPAPWDDDARRWLARFLPGILREGSFNVKARVARARTQGGVDAVLRMIGTISSSGSKRAHYEALLEDGRLSGEDVAKIIQHAGRNVPSSGDLRSVLTKAAPNLRGVRPASSIEQAALAVASSGDRTAVLRAFGQTTDRDLLLSVMRVAETIPSSGDKASLLKTLAPSYLDGNDDALRDAFFKTLATVPSSGDMRSVLTGAAMGYAAANEKVAYAIATAALDVPSSGDRTSVLLGLADVRALKSARVRDAYLKATEGLASGDAARALRAATY
jgi:beta-lactamase regulating signal transducer with metallopeptidase domain